MNEQNSNPVDYSAKQRRVKGLPAGGDDSRRACAERELEFSHRLLAAANRETRLQPLLAGCVAEIRAFTGAAAAGIRLAGGDGTVPYIACEGFPPDFCEVVTKLSTGTDHCVCTKVLRGDVDPAQPCYTSGGSFCALAMDRLPPAVALERQTWTRDACMKEGFQSLAVTPLRAGRHILGLIHVADTHEGRVSVDIVEVLERVGIELAMTIQRLRVRDQLQRTNQDLNRRVAERTAEAELRANQLQALALELTRAEHRERWRLARVLHDHLQQLLVAAQWRLEGAKRLARNPQCRAVLEEIDDILSDSISASRSLTVELSPPVLHNVGLAPALEWLGQEVKAKHGLPVQVDADSDAEPDNEDLRGLLFHAVRELLFNVVKHAEATMARVTMRRADEQVRIEVRDDGAGFDLARVGSEEEPSTGMGLFSIRERLDLLGGRLEIASAIGEGTTITMTAPAVLTDGRGMGPPAGVAAAVAEAVATAADMTTRTSPQSRNPELVTRVLLADDHKVMLDGLNALLTDEGDIEVVAQATDGLTAVALARSTRPDVVLIDVTMPGIDGIEATRRIVAEQPTVRVIGLSMHEEEGVVARMLNAGAFAYLTKDGRTDALLAAIRGTPASTT